MLTNFILDADLILENSKVMSYYPRDLTLTPKINLAFELTLNELRSRGIEPRRLHLPIDLNRDFDSLTKQDQSIPLTKTANGNSSKYAIGMPGFRRFVVNVTAFTGTSIALVLQGSNDILQNNTDLPANWNTITTLSFIAIGTKSIVFTAEYKYYRLAWTIIGDTPSITFTSGIVETCYDQLIIQKTFVLIYRDWTKDTTDIWYDKMRSAEQMFESVMESVKFSLDLNDDNLPVKDESEEGAEERFMR